MVTYICCKYSRYIIDVSIVILLNRKISSNYSFEPLFVQNTVSSHQISWSFSHEAPQNRNRTCHMLNRCRYYVIFCCPSSGWPLAKYDLEIGFNLKILILQTTLHFSHCSLIHFVCLVPNVTVLIYSVCVTKGFLRTQLLCKPTFSERPFTIVTLVGLLLLLAIYGAVLTSFS